MDFIIDYGSFTMLSTLSWKNFANASGALFFGSSMLFTDKVSGKFEILMSFAIWTAFWDFEFEGIIFLLIDFDFWMKK